jgi:hypothetical protein
LWLLSNLIPNPKEPKEKMCKGCQVFFPDTIFYNKDGNIDCLIQNDKDGCLAYQVDHNKQLS